MNLSKADVAMLGRRALQPVKAEGELLAVFVPGKLRNPLNSMRHWRAEKRYRVEWHERVATALLECGHYFRIRLGVPPESGSGEGGKFIGDRIPKVVTFLAHTGGRMDGDGLQASLKPVRDALVECGVLSGDADKDGHTFVYSQRVDRARRGVEIRVRLAPRGSAAVAAP